MNGHRNPIPRFSSDHEAISPTSLYSPLSETLSSAVSSSIDARVLRGTAPLQPSARSAALFHQLPPEVIERVLWAADANGFASLCLLNRTWYQKAQDLELYAYHLSRCPSYALSNNVITGPFRKNDLLRLKAKFAAEVRRNLFDAYLRPRETRINLISVSANSSAAFPGGEAFRFEFSPNGRTILAISSSRIYVLDASSDTIEVRRELKTLRRPLSASVTDDGSLLAVLSSKYQANVYALTPGNPVKHVQVIVLDNPPKTIALAHEGTVLAAAWQGGIEVFSLAANALSTDRRAVRSEAVDSLMFSGDGSMIIGSSHNLEEPNAVVITAPFYTENDPNITPREIHSRMWTTQILFPQISSTVSHVALLPGHVEGDANWLFAYDHTLMTYRAVRTDDTRSGVAYFLSPPTAERFESPQPCIAPVATACGTLAAAGFVDHGLWIYGVPERLDLSPDMGSVVERHEERMHGRLNLTTATGHIEPLMAYSPSVSGSSEMIEEDGLAGKVDWRQSLFVKCKAIQGIPGFASAKWVENTGEHPCAFPGKRLIVTALAGVGNLAEDLGEENMPVDGSRICLLDFDYGISSRQHREFTIEVGDNEAELLTEQLGNMEIEVAMERRRTVRATRGRSASAAKTSLGRSQTAASPPNQSHIEEIARTNFRSQPSSPSESALSPLTRSTGLSRSQTAAGFQHARYPPRPPLATAAAAYYGMGHPPHGRLPHRASRDSWETPPPPYAPDGTRPQTSTPNLRASASQDSSHSAALNGNLAQLGVFQNANQVRSAPAQQGQNGQRGNQFIRVTTGLDGMMNSEHSTSPRMVGQYGGLTRSPRPHNIPEEGPEHSVSDVTGTGSVQLVSQPTAYPAHTPLSPSGNADGYFGGRRPQRYDSVGTNESLALRPTMTHPMSPPTPDRQAWIPDQGPLVTPPSAHRESGLSLTGANLQNRLNHPVPPVPNEEASIPIGSYSHSPPHAHTYPLSPAHPATPMQPFQASPVTQLVPDQQITPKIPTPEQMARLSRRHSPLPSPLVPGHQAAKTATYGFGTVPHSPSAPRGAWGAAGIPGSPTFNRAIATPNGLNPSLSRNGSRGSDRSISASRSTPNLFQGHIPRPSYTRLDTINSIHSGMVPGQPGHPHERTQSLAEGRYSMYENRQFQDRRRVVIDPALGAYEEDRMERKSKKKGSGGKSGRRCVVM